MASYFAHLRPIRRKKTFGEFWGLHLALGNVWRTATLDECFANLWGGRCLWAFRDLSQFALVLRAGLRPARRLERERRKTCVCESRCVVAGFTRFTIALERYAFAVRPIKARQSNRSAQHDGKFVSIKTAAMSCPQTTPCLSAVRLRRRFNKAARDPHRFNVALRPSSCLGAFSGASGTKKACAATAASLTTI